MAIYSKWDLTIIPVVEDRAELVDKGIAYDLDHAGIRGDLDNTTTCHQAAISAFRIAAITALVKVDVVASPPRSAVSVPLPMAPATPSRSCFAVVRDVGSCVRWYSQSSNCAVDRISAAGLARPLPAISGAVPWTACAIA